MIEQAMLPPHWEGKLTAVWGDQMQELLQQLRHARLHAAADEIEDAKRHIDKVLALLDDAFAQGTGPKPSVRAVRGYIAEARFAAAKSYSRSVVAALDEALRVLDESRPRWGSDAHRPRSTGGMQE